MKSTIPVVILAGGLATRLRPWSTTIPKCLMKINDVPFIDYQLRLLQSQGIERVLLCLGYLGDFVMDFVGDGSQYGLQIDCSFDGQSLLGTAGAIKKALSLLENDFFVMYGDAYLNCDFAKVQKAYFEQNKLACMTVFKNENQWDQSNIEMLNNQIVRYEKQHPTKNMKHIDYGLGVFNKVAFQIIPDDQPYDLATLYQQLLAKNELAAFEVNERFYEIGSFQGIEDFSQFIVHQSHGLINSKE